MQNAIKSLITLLVFSALLCGCSSLRETSEEKTRRTEAVKTCLDKRSYQIDIDAVHPLRGGTRLVSTFYLKVNMDTLVSNLPYFGVAYSLPYGQTKGLNFTAEISDYSDASPKKGRREISFSCENEEDKFVYKMTVFDNGKASVTVVPINRDQISFSGEMVLQE